MANSRIGVENLVLFKVLTDPAGGTTTYDTPVEQKILKYLNYKNKIQQFSLSF